MFAHHGIPELLVTDNGRQFVAAEFQTFADQWGFRHTTSSISGMLMGRQSVLFVRRRKSSHKTIPSWPCWLTDQLPQLLLVAVLLNWLWAVGYVAVFQLFLKTWNLSFRMNRKSLRETWEWKMLTSITSTNDMEHAACLSSSLERLSCKSLMERKNGQVQSQFWNVAIYGLTWSKLHAVPLEDETDVTWNLQGSSTTGTRQPFISEAFHLPKTLLLGFFERFFFQWTSSSSDCPY